jgi:hypothetical protein
MWRDLFGADKVRRYQWVRTTEREDAVYEPKELLPTRRDQVKRWLLKEILAPLVLLALGFALFVFLFSLIYLATSLIQRGQWDEIVAGLTVFAIGGLTLTGLLLLMRLSFGVYRVGYPTLRAVLGQATAAPFWAGATLVIPVIFVEAPGLETVDFRPRPELIRTLIGVNRLLVAWQLDHVRQGRLPYDDDNGQGGP